MRRVLYLIAAFALALGTIVVPAGSASADHPECAESASKCQFPTPQECAAGDHNGVWDGGVDGRGAICVSAGGVIILYTGGNAGEACGVIIVADEPVTGDPADDPNDCP